MITLFHGNDIVSSRNAFADLKDQSSVSLDAEDLSLSSFSELLSGDELFPREKNFFIENIFSKKSSKKFETLVDLINKNSQKLIFYLWEDSEISPRQISSLKNIKEKNFKLPKNLFLFLDSIRPGNKEAIGLFHKTLSESDENIIFFMILRQFRLLLSQALGIGSIDEIKRLASWQRGKLQRQASQFQKDRLLRDYKKLYEIDRKHKTGVLDIPLSKSIDFFLLGL